MARIVDDSSNLCTIGPVRRRCHPAMTESISRRAPALPQARPTTDLKPLTGGRLAATRRIPGETKRRTRTTARSRHSPQELSLMALCAGAVTLVAGLIVFTTMRDLVYLDRTEPLMAPLKP